MPARAGSQDSKTPSTILAGVEDDARRAGEELGTRGSSHWANGKATTGAPYHRRNRQSKTESTPANGGVSGGGGGGIEKLLLPLRKSPSPETHWASVAADRLPTPTEQTPSPRSNMSSVGARGFAFGYAPTLTSQHGGGGGRPGSAEDGDHDRYLEENVGGVGGARSGGSGEGRGSHSPAEGWKRSGGNSGDEAEGEGGGSGGGGGGGGDAGFREELEVFASSMRKEFELKLLTTASVGLKAACQRERSAGRLRLEAHKRQSAEEVLHLEVDGRRLRAEAAQLRTANEALTGKAEVLGERLSALHARASSGSWVARCLCAWRREAARMRTERAKNVTAGDHARRKLISRCLNAWREEARVRIDSRGRKAADLKLHAISKEIVGRYEAELSRTRAALDDAMNQIALEKARQREMEEGMRRTLLRGMSAMNMEAMRLMTEARDAGEEDFGVSGTTAGTRYSIAGTDPSSFLPRNNGNGHHRLSEEWPRPLTPPRPAAPSSR